LNKIDINENLNIKDEYVFNCKKFINEEIEKKEDKN
jgi:hypothetical protein